MHHSLFPSLLSIHRAVKAHPQVPALWEARLMAHVDVEKKQQIQRHDDDDDDGGRAKTKRKRKER